MSRQALLLSLLVGVGVVALWWLFLYAPGQDDLAAVEADIDAARTEQTALQQRVTTLETVRARAPETEAAIAQLASIVPADPGLAGALRQIAAAADDAGVTLDAVGATRPEAVEEDPDLYAQTLNITATGSYFQLVDFLRRVEAPEITARGIVFDTMTVATDEYPALSFAVSGQMYSVLAPPPEPATEADVPAEQPTEEPTGGETP